MSSKINVNKILKKHNETLNTKNDKLYFVRYPLIGSIIIFFILGKPNSDMVNIFAVSLSIFIGLFLNLLVLILSFAKTNSYIKDEENRLELLKETFYNLSYTIILSLIALGVLFLTTITFFPSDLSFTIEMSLMHKSLPDVEIVINEIISFFMLIYFYFVLIKVILTLLMIIKRIFNLFEKEIEQILKEHKKNNNKTSYEDYD